eukprot:CAMPEP_0178919706 /NCGR_PEP_ID=MMETSP0786-20121207/14593_1 /TAXON_ID=186022 /ORGANISM="Thalassionema frauenfeldii, Strain CCMP 1798" /LENGTH=202 /DNA_ID=CAMNT_0020593681 /DNA_START=64 /DNA_END=669 /DNA_ORIENTATION=-
MRRTEDHYLTDIIETALSQSSLSFNSRDGLLRNNDNDDTDEQQETNILSDVLFLAGSICYMITSLSDRNYYANDDDDDDGTLNDTVYRVLSLVGAGLYLLNALVDIYWSVVVVKTNNNIEEEEEIKDDIWMDNGYLVSAHLYLLSSLLALGSIDKYYTCNGIAGLRLVGDILFVAGSAIDTAIGYISDPVIVVVQGWTLAEW